MFFDVTYFILKIIVFIIIIYGAQYAWDILKDTYTKPKTKYLVNPQLKKYQEMVGDTYNEAGDNKVMQNSLFQDEATKQQMCDELSQFMSGQTNEL